MSHVQPTTHAHQGHVIDFKNLDRARLNLSAEEIKVPKISRTLDEAVAQVKPLFEKWVAADQVFAHNTNQVAKAVAGAWSIFKAADEAPTKVKFARFFDSSIAEDAKVRDVVSNVTFNRIQYLLHKVAPAGDSVAQPVSARDRLKAREKGLRKEWRSFVKTWKESNLELEDVKLALHKMLAIVMPESAVDRVLDGTA